jgi:hypothetical protein
LFFKKSLSLVFFFLFSPEQKRKVPIVKALAFTTIYEVNGSSLKESILYKNMQKSCQLRQSLVRQGFDGVLRVEGR